MKTLIKPLIQKTALCVVAGLFTMAAHTALAEEKPIDMKRSTGTTFKVLELNHTAFTVSDLDRMIRFFVECLGMELELRRFQVHLSPNAFVKARWFRVNS